MENEIQQWKVIQAFKVDASEVQFWKAFDIYSERPHIINRRLLGAEILAIIHLDNNQKLTSIKRFLLHHKNEPNIKMLLQNEYKPLDDIKGEESRPNTAISIIRKLLSKNSFVKHQFEIIVKGE